MRHVILQKHTNNDKYSRSCGGSGGGKKVSQVHLFGGGLLLHTCSHRDSWGHGEEITDFCEGTGPQSYAEHRGGEGKDIPSTAALRSSTERECCFSDGVGGEPVRPGPAWCVSVLYLIYYFYFF